MWIASVFVLFSIFAVPTLAQNTGTEEKALRELWGRFEEAYNQSNAAKVASLYAPNGDRINGAFQLARGRVEPNFSLDLAAGAEIYCKESRSATLQIQVANLANRLNVINFASIFSGTALGEPRSVSANLRLAF